MALTALWQGAESWAKCCFRQVNASAPPRGTPEQFAMKSDRHEERIALTCSGLGCCAWAVAARTTIAAHAALDRPRRIGILATPVRCDHSKFITANAPAAIG
jgi:hypothetical protein